MNKNFLVCFSVMLFMLSFVIADSYVNIDIDSGNAETTIWANPNSGTGDTNYIIDGIDFDSTVNNINHNVGKAGNSGISIGSVYSQLSNVFMKFDGYHKEWKYTEPNYRNYQETNYRNIMVSYFMPRQEIIRTGQFNYCVLEIALIETREKLNFYDAKCRGLKFMFRYNIWRKWEQFAHQFSKIIHQINAIRQCLSGKELAECYIIKNEYLLLKSVSDYPKILDEDWFWWLSKSNRTI